MDTWKTLSSTCIVIDRRKRRLSQDWLRRYTVSGNLDDHNARATPRQVQSVVCVGVRSCSRGNGMFFYQWFLLHRPNRSSLEFIPPDPPSYMNNTDSWQKCWSYGPVHGRRIGYGSNSRQNATARITWRWRWPVYAPQDVFWKKSLLGQTGPVLRAQRWPPQQRRCSEAEARTSWT